MAADRRWWGLKSGIVPCMTSIEESDCCAAVVGLFPDDGGEFLVKGGGFNAEGAEGAEFFLG